MSSIIQDYKRAISSGGYLHPETRKNMSDTRPIETIDYDIMPPGKGAVITTPKRREIGPKIFLTIAVLFFLGALWLAYQPDPKSALATIWTPTTETELDNSQAIENDYHYQVTQDAAIEQIRAWERVHNTLIHEFFSTPLPASSKRTLCITMGDKKDCTVRMNPLNSRH